MLADFHVVNFRGFTDLVVTDLARVNLVTGRNNAGKTTLLEALAVYARAGLPVDVAQLLAARGEVCHSGDFESVSALFHRGHQAEVCSLGPSDGPTLGLARMWAVRRRPAKGRDAWEIRPDPDPVDESHRVITVEGAFGRKYFRAHVTSMEALAIEWPQYLPCLTVFSGGLDTDESAAHWKHIAGYGEREHEVVAALQLIEPGIRTVHFLQGDSADGEVGEYYCRVSFEGQDKPLPLRSFGEGMHRVLEIALAMVNCQGGLLLLDEIENGIHFSVLPRLWAFIVSLAERLDVQVFATTHSWDAVEAFQTATDGSGRGRLVRLARDAGGLVTAETLTEAELRLVTRQELEVR